MSDKTGKIIALIGMSGIMFAIGAAVEAGTASSIASRIGFSVAGICIFLDLLYRRKK